MLFFTKNNHINKVTQTKRTDLILSALYDDINNAYKYLNNLKQNGSYFTITTKKISTASQISKPQNFNYNSFPEMIRKHIDELSMSEITYNFSYGRHIKLYFIVEEHNVELKLDIFNKYVDNIIMWLHILNQYASKQCSNTLTVYFYFTSLKKYLPRTNIHILDEHNVNTAFTTTCPKDSEIVVFRHEEWFKVFIHETFHNFGLDFSDMNNSETKNCILNIFKVNSDVNLYESYTEFWAEIMNALFCSFLELKDKNDIDEFSNSEFFINFERTYSFFQLVKTLNFMGLTYKDLYSNNERSRMLRENLYKEKTSVLSYYIIKTIIINNYQAFLFWCKNNNFSLLQFKKTPSSQKEYCKFIEKNYKTSSMLAGIAETQKFLNKTQKDKKRNAEYVLSNLRMSICEMG
jgi:hypothetical protein